MSDGEDRPEENDKEEQNDDDLRPIATIRKFDDLVTAVKLRKDGQIVLCGDKLGKVQLIQIKSKLVLRQYKEFKHEVSSLDFSSTGRFFVASANETSWKYFDIQVGDGSVFTCQKAHSDHIKIVRFVRDDLVLSASADKSVKLWRVSEDGAELVSQLKLKEAIEDVC